MEFGLKDSDIEKIKSVLASYNEVEKAILYGSRAKGNYKPASDIDLTLLGSGLDLTRQQMIESKLDDLLLPYKFDISIYHQIADSSVIEHIKRVGKFLYERPALTS
jgi:predicted nucleotidyltransferase